MAAGARCWAASRSSSSPDEPSGRSPGGEEFGDRLRGLDRAGESGGDGGEVDDLLKLVELGRIVCFFPASLTLRYPRSEIAYRRVEDLEPATLSVAWPQHSRSTAVAAFVRAATKVAATAQPEPGTPQTAAT